MSSGSRSARADFFGGDRELAIVPELARAAEESERVITRRLRRAAALSLRDLLVLDQLHRARQDGIRTKRLAERLSISTSRLAYQLKGLEQKGWIERTPHGEDRRGVVVALTECGDEARGRAMAALAEFSGDGLSGLADELPTDDLVRAYDALAPRAGSSSQVTAEQAACFGQWCLETVQSAESFDQMFELVAERLMGMLELDLVRVLVKSGDVLSCVAIKRAAATPIADHGSSICGMLKVPSTAVIATGEPIFTATRQDLGDSFPELLDYYDRTGITVGRRFAVPILKGAEVVGSLSGGSSAEREWDESSKLVLATMARAVAVRLEYVDGWTLSPAGDGVPSAGTRDEGLTRSLMTAIAWGLDPEEAGGFLELSEVQRDHFLDQELLRRSLVDRAELIELLRAEHASALVTG